MAKLKYNFENVRFDEVVVERYCGKGVWLLRCDCGRTFEVKTVTLTKQLVGRCPWCGKTNPKGTKIREEMRHSSLKNLEVDKEDIYNEELRILFVLQRWKRKKELSEYYAKQFNRYLPRNQGFKISKAKDFCWEIVGNVVILKYPSGNTVMRTYDEIERGVLDD